MFEITKRKLNKVLCGAIIIAACIVIKCVYVQIIDFQFIYDNALELWQRSFPVEANRGEIIDIDGEVLATSLTTTSLVVIPSQIQDIAYTADKLSTILGVDVEVLVEKLSKNVSIERISPEGRQLEDDVAMQIDRLKLAGVYLIKDSLRYYPNSNYLSHCLGFVGIDNQGLLGLEVEYDEYLTGTNGSIDYYMDAKGNNLDMYASDYIAPQDGYTLQLTIDSDIQDVVERELNNAYDTYNPDSIWAIAMDPQTGEILAMSSKPDFDPNDYQNSSEEIYNQNTPIFRTYEPGSTFKILTFGAALNEGLFDMDEDTYYDIGYEYVGGTKISSWKEGGHGLQTYREVLQNSSNPGFVHIGQMLGKDNLYNYIVDFGLTTKTGIDLPGESTGIMFDYDNFNELEQATVAFGQGISITAIQLVTAVSAAINGGTLYTPYIVNAIIDPTTNETLFQNSPTIVTENIVSKETSELLLDALETVVSDGGGKNAYIDGYRIGGKTGTAQKVEDGQYMEGEYILSFIGIAPVDDPQIVLYIAMDNPKNCIQYGGTTVAPIARNMFLDILPILEIEQVEEQIPKVSVYGDTEMVEVPQYIGLNKSEVTNTQLTFEFIGTGDTVIDQLPRYGSSVEVGSTVVIMLGDV